MLVAARAGEANERDANKRAAKAATICKRRNAGITMALPVSRGKRRLYLLKARPYLTSQEVRSLLKQGFDIGSHSVDHPLYSELNLDEQLWQTRRSMDWLSDTFGYQCRTFSFPFRDTGVPLEFFARAFADPRLKLSFGTNGMLRHFFPRNLERNVMENPVLTARAIIAREFAVTAIRSDA